MVNNLEKWQKNSQKRFSSLRNSTEILNIKVKNQIQIKDKNQSQLVEETNFSNQSLKLNNSVLKTDDYTFLPKIETKKKQLGEKISSSASFQKNSIHLPEIKRKESGKFNEENFQIEDDNLIESLKNKMHLFLSDNIEIDSFTKKSVLYSKIVDNIISKMNKRISFLETFLIKKNKNLLIFRTETSVILEKIQNLKTLVYFL